jgi:hypothetical protein
VLCAFFLSFSYFFYQVNVLTIAGIVVTAYPTKPVHAKVNGPELIAALVLM